jgi:tryptophan synthase alpha chain
MSRIRKMFQRLRNDGGRGFVAYLTAGDPSLPATIERVLHLADLGVDLVELGLPFSDPLADGRVNQAAAERALAAGTTLVGVLDVTRVIRAHSDIPLVLYSYLNPLLAHGFEETVRAVAAAGFDGILPLDLPPEEADAFQPSFERSGLDRICLVSPTSGESRIPRIVRRARGFVYCISRAGVTGAREQLADQAGEVLRLARRYTALPLALGFGISTPDQARVAATMADAVVVGSALVQRWHEAGVVKSEAVDRWVKEMVEAVHGR